jgi:hypothetical protein
MRYFTFFIFALMIVSLALPAEQAFARRGGDDDSSESDHHGRGRGGDDNRSDDSRSRTITSSRLLTKDNAVLNGTLEVEADVFTDTTIVKVENNDRKAVFSTTADTKDEVVDVVNEKFGFSKSSIEAVLSFEIEDRASRAKERARISGSSTTTGNSSSTDAELKARINELQNMINRLIALLNSL